MGTLFTHRSVSYTHLDVYKRQRLDSVIAAMSGKSRSQSVVLIQSGKIFINGAECLHNTYLCKQNDVISIRGTGTVSYTHLELPED